jgi:hypothetical protein
LHEPRYTTGTISGDAGQSVEETQLLRILDQEKLLLSETGQSIEDEIDRCKRMLEEFREQRRKILEAKIQDNKAKRANYEQELVHIKNTIMNEEAEFNIHIRSIDGHSVSEDISSGLNNSAALVAHHVESHRSKSHRK